MCGPIALQPDNRTISKNQLRYYPRRYYLFFNCGSQQINLSPPSSFNSKANVCRSGPVTLFRLPPGLPLCHRPQHSAQHASAHYMHFQIMHNRKAVFFGFALLDFVANTVRSELQAFQGFNVTQLAEMAPSNSIIMTATSCGSASLAFNFVWSLQ